MKKEERLQGRRRERDEEGRERGYREGGGREVKWGERLQGRRRERDEGAEREAAGKEEGER